MIGAPQSGRSTFLRTIAASLALTYDPARGERLRDGPVRRRTAADRGLPARGRRRHPRPSGTGCSGCWRSCWACWPSASGCSGIGIDSMTMLRTAHAAGRVPELVSADVVLLVDGFAQLRDRLRGARGQLRSTCCSGAAASASTSCWRMTRWNELRMAHQPLVGTRSSCKLNDPADSVIGRKLAATITAKQPGRLLTEDSLFAQVALPVLDDTDDARWARRSRRWRSGRRPAGTARPPRRSGCCPIDFSPR